MVENQFRHPKFALLIVLIGFALGLVAVVGPRDATFVGVDDASAATDESTSSVPPPVPSTDSNAEDGVTFTVPDGELGVVIEATPTTLSAEAIEPIGETLGSTLVVPPTTSLASPAPTASPTPTTTTTANGVTQTDGTDVAVVDVDDPQDQGGTEEISTAAPGIAQVTSSESAAALAAFTDAGTLVGSARGGPGSGEQVVLGQLGTRDANSVPWILLIAANFFVAGGALAFLRLRR